MGQGHSHNVKTRRSDGPEESLEQKVDMAFQNAEGNLKDSFEHVNKDSLVKFLIHLVAAISLLLFLALAVLGGLKMGVAPSYGMGATDVPSQFYGGLFNLLVALVGIGTAILISASSFLRFQLGLKLALGLLLLLIVNQAILGALAGLFTEGNHESLRPAMLSVFNKSVHSEHERLAWENIQQEHECCGVVGPFQYFNPYRNIMNVPLSCCQQNGTSQVIHTQNKGYLENVRRLCIARAQYFKTGCMDKAGDTYKHFGVAIVVLTLLSVPLLLGFAFLVLDRLGYLEKVAEQEKKNHPHNNDVKPPGPPPN